MPPDFVPFDRAALDRSLVDIFQEQVAKRPDDNAILDETRNLTYRHLNGAANALAHVIRSVETRPSAVALLMNQGSAAIVAIIAILKAGCFFVPLDPSAPAATIAAVLRDCGATLLLADSRHELLAREAAGELLSVLPVTASSLLDSAADLPPLSTSNSYAYIYFTSGSTGRAKGVVDSHRNVLHNVRRYTNRLFISPSDRLTLLQACSFSGAVSSLFGALLNGAASCPIDYRSEGATGVRRAVERERITVFHSVPAIFRSVFGDSRARFPGLRVIRLEGDQASVGDLKVFREMSVSDCVLANGLGTTETGLIRQFMVDAHSPQPLNVVPVGYQVEDMNVVVVDEAGEPVPANELGEIAVTSEFLAIGYWERPDLTAAAFRPATQPQARTYRTGDLARIRPDGCLEYLGRRDESVARMNGRNIPLREVDAALACLPGVADSVVVMRVDAGHNAKLVGYIVADHGAELSVGELKRGLNATLPDYMIPTSYVFVANLPITPDGKVDRRALPAPSRSRPRLSTPLVEPGSDSEVSLAAIWTGILELDEVGVRDDFFELGGDSLLASQLVARVEALMGVQAPLEAVFVDRTVERLAQRIDAMAWLQHQHPSGHAVGDHTGST